MSLHPPASAPGWRAGLGPLALALLAALPGPARAQSDWSRHAVPFYAPQHLVQGLHRSHAAPRAAAFAADSQALARALVAHCAGRAPVPGAARAAWRQAARQWDGLSAVALGPLIERQALRQLDFQPARPALIDAAVAARPRGPDALARIGAPAKGLPALELLLWTRPLRPGQPACSYAVELAADLARQAAALAADWQPLADPAAPEPEEDATRAAVDELLNQWIGGLERLRWARMDKPLRAGRPQDLPRAVSGDTAASWAAQWAALRALAVWATDGGRGEGEVAAELPVPGQGGRLPLETYLRGRGLNPLADRLRDAVARVDARLPAARPADPASVQAVAADLAALRQLAEQTLAPALEVQLGFSDADGD